MHSTRLIASYHECLNEKAHTICIRPDTKAHVASSHCFGHNMSVLLQFWATAFCRLLVNQTVHIHDAAFQNTQNVFVL